MTLTYSGKFSIVLIYTTKEIQLVEISLAK